MTYYREISSAEILLPGEDARTPSTGVRIPDLSFHVQDARLLRQVVRMVHRQRGNPVLPLIGVALLAALATLGILGMVRSPRAPPVMTASALPPLALPAPAPAAPLGRRIDSEPSGALVYLGDEVIGTTPFRYDTPPDRALGLIRLRLVGFWPEERVVGVDAPAVLAVKLRRR